MNGRSHVDIYTKTALPNKCRNSEKPFKYRTLPAFVRLSAKILKEK